MRILIQLLLSVSIPLSLGVMLVFFLYYYSVYHSLNAWENISIEWLKTNEMQILHNTVYVDKLISQIHLQKISNDLITYQGLYNKFVNRQVKILDENKSYKNCSYKYFNNNECDVDIYDAFKVDNQSSYFVDLYFHRTLFTFNSFNTTEQQLLRTNWDFYFLAKSIVTQSKNDLISISFVYNTYNDSLLTSAPSHLSPHHSSLIYSTRNTNLSSVPYQTCQGNNFIEPYDPRCRGWYINALKTPGNQFYKPYLDLFSSSTIMTGSARIDDANGNNYSVISVDFIIKNLIQNIFQEQDQESANNNVDSYSVLFHVENNTVYHHKNWDSSERTLMSWEDLEFNRTFSPYKDEERLQFIEQVENSKEFSLTYEYSIDEQINTTQFYQYWHKNNKPQQY